MLEAATEPHTDEAFCVVMTDDAGELGDTEPIARLELGLHLRRLELSPIWTQKSSRSLNRGLRVPAAQRRLMV